MDASPTQPSAVIDWNASCAIGVEDIDFQHHYFANLINRIGTELSTTTDEHYIRSMLVELNAYARFHFVSEENLMHRAGFPGLDEHRRLHIQLIDELSAREGRLFLGITPRASDDVLRFLVGWFLGHTTTEDRKFATYLQSKSSRAVGSDGVA